MTSSQPNPTIVKFGYPASLIKEYENWVVLLRPGQCTLAALVLVNKSEIQSFSAIGSGSFQELERVTRDIERNLKAFRPFQKINYLMLMMVDREVHFHVVPRYDADQEFGGTVFRDPGWPAVPDLAAGPVLRDAQMASLVSELKRVWAS